MENALPAAFLDQAAQDGYNPADHPLLHLLMKQGVLEQKKDNNGKLVKSK